MANRYWFGGSGTWDNSSTARWSAAVPISIGNASCSGTTLTTTTSPALVVGMTVIAVNNVSLGTITAGSGNSWTVSIGGTHATTAMLAATLGASAPTSSDSVFFTSTAHQPGTAYTVTIGLTATPANCLDFSAVASSSGTVTINSAATAVINCYGSWTNAASGVIFVAVIGSAINFLATTTGKTISTNNRSLGTSAVTFNGVGGGWTLGSAFTVVIQATTITAGAFSTGGFAFTGAAINASGTLTRSVTLGASALVLTGTNVWTFTTTTNLTFSGASATINCNGASPNFLGGGLIYGTVNFTNATIATVTLTGTNTFTNLNFTSRSAAGLGNIIFGANQTVSGTLTLGTANAGNNRFFVQSDIIGAQRTLTVATIAALSDIDFRDIVAAGASGTWSGTRIGNCKNNSNITFTTAKTVYFSSSAGASANWVGAVWATSSGGTDFSINNFPLAQDTIYIDNAGATTGNGLRTGGVITFSANWNMGNLISTRTAAYAINQGNNDPVIYGDFTLSSGVSFTVLTSPTWTFAGQGVTQNITTAGKTINATQVLVNSPGGTVKLLDAWTQAVPSGATSATFNLSGGTLDLNGFTLTANAFSNSNSNTRTLAFGTTGKIVLAGNSGTVYSSATGTGLSVTGTSPLVQFTYSGGTGSRNIVMSGLTEAESISVEFLNNATDTVVIQGTSGAYRNIDFTNFNGTITTANSPRVYGNLTLGTNVQTNAFVGTSLNFASTSGTKTITSNGIAFDVNIGFIGIGGAWQLIGNLTTGSNRILTANAGTVDLNNNTLTGGKWSSSGTSTRSIAFGTGKIVLTDTSGTMYNIDTATGYTYTGTSRFEFPNGGSGTTRSIFHGITDGTEANVPNIYVTGGVDTFSVSGTGRKYGTINFTGFSGTPEIVGNTYIYGDLVLSATGSDLTTQTNPIIFAATTSRNITTNGILINGPITFDGVGGGWLLLDNLSCPSSLITLINGTFYTAGKAVSSAGFSSSNSNIRGLFLANGTNWSLNGTGTVWDCAISTNLTIYSSSPQNAYLFLTAGPCTFVGGSLEYPSLVFNNLDVTITGANTFYTLINISQASTVRFPAGVTTTITDPYANDQFDGYGVGYELTLNSSTPGTQATIAIPNNLQLSKDYVTYQDINISTQNSLWYTKPNSVVGTNVTGVTTTLGEFLSLF